MKILVTGLGSIGQRHVRNLRQMFGMDVDISAYRVRGLDLVLDANMQATYGKSPIDHYGLTEFRSLDEALDQKPDAMIVANPISYHVEVAQAAADSECGLFIEKPLSDRWDGVENLVQTVAEKNLAGFVAYQLRYHPGLLKLKKLLDERRVGKLISAEVHFGEYLPGMHPYEDYRESHAARSDQGGGAILCLSHDLDYAQWLFGMPQRVFALGGHLSDLEMDVEDTASILMDCVDGDRTFPVHVYVDFIQQDATRRCRVVGESGTITWDYYARSISIYDANTDTTTTEVMADFDRNKLFLDEISHFLACVRGEEESSIPIDEGANTLKLALAAREAMQKKQVLEV